MADNNDKTLNKVTVDYLNPNAKTIRNQNRKYGKEQAFSDVRNATQRRRYEMDQIDRTYPRYKQTLYDNIPGLRQTVRNNLDQLDSIGPSQIESELSDQALSELRLGGQLTDEERMEVAQGSRAAWSARGLVNSTPAAAGEVLDRVAYSNARKASRRNFAAGVDQQVNDRQKTDRQFNMASMAMTNGMFNPFTNLYPRGSQEGRYDMSQSINSSNIGQSIKDRAQRTMLAGEDRKLQREGLDLRREELQLRYKMFEEGLDWDKDAFNMNRADTLDNADRNANAARNASSDSNTSAYVSAGASIASAAILAFAL